MNKSDALPAHTPILIVGGGPIGLTLSGLLTHFEIKHVLIEADASYCTGSRAICVSRRSQEILAWFGADRALLNKGLAWTGGRSYWRDQEILHFQMPAEPTQRFAPMVNIQQFYIERFAHEAAQQHSKSASQVHWSTRLQTLDVSDPAQTIATVFNDTDKTEHVIRADYLIACDGGRSTVRELMGLQLAGIQYEGRYVIVDIEQESKRPVERLAWFDPPSNPGSTLLMHRQPDKVWRIDYQVRDDEDPIEAVKPENVLPRVQSHLSMIGETAAWKPLWISIYNAKCLTLPQYRYGRVLFAGDAGHLVPIFGVRGLNSGVDDAGNLAWKLALVVSGKASTSLLDSYSDERVQATHENIKYGAKSTEFMAPPHFGFRLMREAALRLATINPSVRSLINPRQSTPIAYLRSSLNASSTGWEGHPAPEALFAAKASSRRQPTTHLSQLFGHYFVLLHFSSVELPFDIQALDQSSNSPAQPTDPSRLRVIQVEPAHTQAWERYLAADGTAVLIRPDGYILGRWLHGSAKDIQRALHLLLTHPTLPQASL
jgi:3-(3-hydroxy-phenyl)propionate hydroxylase